MAADRSLFAGLINLEMLDVGSLHVASVNEGEDVLGVHPASPVAEGIAEQDYNPLSAEEHVRNWRFSRGPELWGMG